MQEKMVNKSKHFGVRFTAENYGKLESFQQIMKLDNRNQALNEAVGYAFRYAKIRQEAIEKTKKLLRKFDIKPFELGE